MQWDGADSKKTKIAEEVTSRTVVRSRQSTKAQPDDFIEDDNQSFTEALDDGKCSREQSSVSDRRLRPRKSAQHVLDSESDDDDQSYTEELHSEYEFTADYNDPLFQLDI